MAKSSSNGIDIVGILTVIFVTLKLINIGVVATWSWWWVLSPLWIPLSIALFVGMLTILFKR